MTCLLDEGLDGPGIKSHTSLLGTFFVYTLGPRIPIFKKKSSLKRLGKSSKISIVVTLLQWKFWNFFPDVSGKIFSWKLVYVVPRCIQKTSPTEKYVTLFLARPDLRLVSKSLKCFTNRVVKFMYPCVYWTKYFAWEPFLIKLHTIFDTKNYHAIKFSWLGK